MTTYNGHRSWNAWNVSLYIANEEPLYRAAVEAIKRSNNLKSATNRFFLMTGLRGQKTPDGAIYNPTCVYEALAGLEITERY